jgi:hypothetical protein
VIEQDKVNKTRIIGYTIGIVAFVIVAVWKLALR